MEKKKEPSCTVGGNVNCVATVENSMELPKKLKIELSYDLQFRSQVFIHRKWKH